MESDTDAQRAALLRRYSKLNTTLTDLCEALKVIKENALSPEEIKQLSIKGGDLEQAVADSSVVNMTTYLREVESTSQILQSYDSDNFKKNGQFFYGLVKYPVIADSSLENLAFLHKSWASMNAHANKVDMAVATNERLEFLGDSWLGAFVSYILYKKYPYANEGALSKMRSAIVNNINLVKWCKKVGFDQRLQANIPRRVNKVKDMSSKYYADCFEAYVGALVVDRYATEFKGVVEWIERLSGDIFNEMGSQMVADPMNKNAKHELSSLLLHNKAGAQLAYHRLNSSSPFKIEVKLGDISLATAEGSSIREAEQRAAMKALLDTSKIKTYSLYELEDDNLIEDSDANGVVPVALIGVDTRQHAPQSEPEDTTSEESRISSEKSIRMSAEEKPISSSPNNGKEEGIRPQVAPEGISQAQMAEIVEQLTGRLRETVLSTVTAALTDNGLQIPRNSGGKTSGLAAPVENSEESTVQNLVIPNSPARVRAVQKKPVKAETSFKLYNPEAEISPAFSPSVTRITRPALEIQPATTRTLPKLPQAPGAISHDSVKPQLIQLQSANTESLTGTQNIVQDSGLEPFTLDSSWKQKLYAFLGPRGCKPYYKTEAEGLQTFFSSCMIEGFNIVLGTGSASSKKQAEQIAAYHGLRSEELKEFLVNPSAFSVLNE